MVIHSPDAGRETRSHFSYKNALERSDLDTAREFAFQALGDGSFQKGEVRVVFPEKAIYHFHFERAGIMGYHLTQTRQQSQVAF
jgi:hypothetical protein